MKFWRKTRRYYDNRSIRYEAVLGFTQNNYSSLKNQIQNAIKSGKAILISMRYNEHHVIEYNYRIQVRGVNRNTAFVIAKYGIKEGSEIPYMITNYIERRKNERI